MSYEFFAVRNRPTLTADSFQLMAPKLKIMLKNYIKIAFRNLWKKKGYTFINITGLAIGLSCFILIGTYIRYELSYDTFNEKADRIYRVAVQQTGNFFLGNDHFAVTPAPLEQALLSDFSEIETATSINDDLLIMNINGKTFQESGVSATATFFDVFSFPLTEGDPGAALASPNSIVLTRALAQKLFGNEHAVGKSITVDPNKEYTVTGIIEEIPENSHFTFDFVSSLLSSENYTRNTEEWRNSSWYTYIVLNNEADADQLQAKLPEFISKYTDGKSSYYLQPLTDIHLRSHINFEFSANNNIRYIYLFSGIALLVLLLASVNYMNLAVAQSIKRTREVGLRKVIGAHRWQLVSQFLSESFITVSLALALALIISNLTLPLFNHLVERNLDLGYLSNPVFILALLSLALFVGLISGSYPAFFVTRLQASSALKGGNLKGIGRSNLRNVLIVGQFAASIMLVAGSIIIFQQLRYIQTTDMGYNREHILTFGVQDRAIRKQADVIKQQLLLNPQIAAVAGSDQLPTNIDSQTSISGWEGSVDDEQEFPIYISGIDYDFVDLYGLEILKGRNFSRDIASDTTQGAYLLSETAVKGLGWDMDSAIGKPFSAWMGDGIVVGVVKDFHMHSLHMEIKPLTLYLDPSRFYKMSVKFQGGTIPETLEYVSETLSKFSNYPINYSFLDDNFNNQYQEEIKLGEIVGYLTFLALCIAALGLFGLSAYAAEQRTKEIGIRKVLGASVSNIVAILSKDFVLLVALGFFIAIPVAWYAMNRWLADFAYRIEIGPGIFVLAGTSALAIALLTVSGQAVKAALANPVESLKSE